MERIGLYRVDHIACAEPPYRERTPTQEETADHWHEQYAHRIDIDSRAQADPGRQVEREAMQQINKSVQKGDKGTDRRAAYGANHDLGRLAGARIPLHDTPELSRSPQDGQ
jgi:hypothetical protein